MTILRVGFKVRGNCLTVGLGILSLAWAESTSTLSNTFLLSRRRRASLSDWILRLSAICIYTSLQPIPRFTKMYLTRLAPVIVLLASSPYVAAWTPADTNQTDVLAAQGLANLAYYEIQGNVQANCSLSNATIRREWYVL